MDIHDHSVPSRVELLRYAPVAAITTTHYGPDNPTAFDCVRLVFIRDESAFLFSEFGQCSVNVGDVVLLCSNTLCSTDSEGHVTATTIFADTDYVIDQVFWQYASVLSDRLDARDLVKAMYVEPAQILHLGEDRARMLMPWLDELVKLTVDDQLIPRFNRVQALLFSVTDVVAPLIRVSPVRMSVSQREQICPTLPRHRRFCPLRAEARKAADLLRADPAHHWTIDEIADRIHMSTSQFAHVFREAYGKTPLAFLTMIRAEELARLLRDTDLPVEAAMRKVGWLSRGHASHLFKQYVGLTPVEYRKLHTRAA